MLDLAGRLSKAARRELMRDYPIRITAADWRVWPSMTRKGLVRSRIATGSIELLPLGIAIRNHLATHRAAKEHEDG